MDLSSAVQPARAREPLDCLISLHPTLNHRDFASVSHQLAASYSRLLELGLPATAIAAAMLGATINFYHAFDLSHDLPSTFRAMADVLENKIKAS
jgi:hypothetical protein